MGKRMTRGKRRLYVYAGKFMHLALLGYIVKWSVIGSLVGVLTGSGSALFLAALDAVTQQRLQHPWLLWLLPFGGALVSYLYWKYGKDASKGNNLILEQIHDGGGAIPLRMAPLVLFGTILTHWFGGSAGREGTAVQMGGSLSEWIGKRLRLSPADRRIILMCGISSGFGSVFGTPLAGTVFGLEVLALGMIRYEALFACFVASFIGDLTTKAWGIHHIHYSVNTIPAITLITVLKVVLASMVFGLASILFSELTHWLRARFTGWFRNPAVKSFAGGCILIAIVYAFGTREYLGLGLPLIGDAFEGTAPKLAFLWKTVFTSITLGAGFQGGEVTPLFVIGATLGSTLAGLLHLAVPFMAALGFIAVFSGATNTPIACFIMGIELFGSENLVYMFIACVVSYYFSGHTGIYVSQRIGVSKSRLLRLPEQATLASVRGKKGRKKGKRERA